MKILVAASGSYDDPDGSLEVAASFPWPEGSEIHVVSVAEVIQPIMVGMVPDAIDAGEVQVRTDSEAKSAATHGAQRFRSYGFQAEGLCLTGDPETEILDYARQWGADLIVVGSHDRSAIDRFLTGSVSESIVKHAPCSVLVLKHYRER
jgi:nucleotide-binding universal stress UspA family protein